MQVYARVFLKNGAITGVTPYSEVGAPPELRGCISRELLGQPLANVGARERERLLTIYFRPGLE